MCCVILEIKGKSKSLDLQSKIHLAATVKKSTPLDQDRTVHILTLVNRIQNTSLEHESSNLDAMITTS